MYRVLYRQYRPSSFADVWGQPQVTELLKRLYPFYLEQTSRAGADPEAPLNAAGAIAVHIRHIREKIEINPADPRYLKVIWGKGYKMSPPVSNIR